MSTPLKRRIAFALTMGMVTTGIISFTIIAFNFGFTPNFARAWLRSWGIAYAIVIPSLLLVAPRVQVALERVIR